MKALLAIHAPGFHARRKRDGRRLACSEPFDKVILWAGVSTSGITAMAYLFESGLILPVFVSHLVYQQCADLPELSRAGTVPLTEEQWAPRNFAARSVSRRKRSGDRRSRCSRRRSQRAAQHEYTEGAVTE